ncbi:ABC transporter permease [Candidatus Latescibacterota bacterium]
MIKTILQRELVDNFKSLRFIMLTLFTILLFSLNGIIFSARYNVQLDEYSKNISIYHRNPRISKADLYKPPSLKMFIAEGGENYRTNHFTLYPKGYIYSNPNREKTYFFSNSIELDWSFIIKIIFSLYVILFSYNAVSGEKNQGTLRQILSNPINRITLLFSKYLAVMITMAVQLILGILISLIIMSFLLPQIITVEILLRTLAMMLIILAYLSLFTFLSLMLSSLIHQSSMVLMTLLFIWILFYIIPEFSIIGAETIIEIPNEYQMAHNINYSRGFNVQEIIDQGKFETAQEAQNAAQNELENKINTIMKNFYAYDNAIINRLQIARNISRLSPMGMFQYASESISGTGLAGENHFISDILNYSLVFDNYIFNKTGKVIATSPIAGVTYVSYNGQYLMIRTPEAPYIKDYSDFPFFAPSKPSIVNSINYALFDLSGLLLWNIVLAILSFMAFLRADVR